MGQDTEIGRDLSGQASIWDEIPHIRKTGRYFFFAVCAFGVGAVAYVLLRAVGTSRDFASPAMAIGMVASFMALRDMSRVWDRSLFAVAQAIEARRAETGTGSVHESADPKGCAQGAAS